MPLLGLTPALWSCPNSALEYLRFSLAKRPKMRMCNSGSPNLHFHSKITFGVGGTQHPASSDGHAAAVVNPILSFSFTRLPTIGPYQSPAVDSALLELGYPAEDPRHSPTVSSSARGATPFCDSKLYKMHSRNRATALLLGCVAQNHPSLLLFSRAGCGSEQWVTAVWRRVAGHRTTLHPVSVRFGASPCHASDFFFCPSLLGLTNLVSPGSFSL